MKRHRPILVLALGAAVSAALLWFVLHTRSATAELRARRTALAARAAQLAAELATAREIVVAPPVASSIAPASETPALAAPVPAKRPPGLMDYARDNPELLNLWIANQRSRVQRNYGVLFEQLRLTPAQREKFKDILAANTARTTDIGATASANGLSIDDPAIKALHADSVRQMEAELNALLGDDAFRRYHDYERTMPVRGFVEGFAVQVAPTFPLTREQADRLADALIAATPVARPDERLDPVNVDWPAVDREAEKVLSAAQLAAWKLGVAHNQFGGPRVGQELVKAYRAATGERFRELTPRPLTARATNRPERPAQIPPPR